MLRRAVVLALVAAACLHAALAYEQLVVISPAALASTLPDIDERPALFGFPNYEASLTAQVIYATPGDQDGCSPLNATYINQHRTGNMPFIVMVDRGNCTFTTKVRNAENVSANAVVVVDNIEESFIPYMRDDGTGESIEIPSFIIRKSNGDTVKQYLDPIVTNGTVVFEMSWGLPHPDNRVEWKLWTTSVDSLSRPFKQNFRVVAQALGEWAELEVGYVVFRGPSSRFPAGSCTNKDRYCFENTVLTKNITVNGSDIIVENTRQWCLWNHANSTSNVTLWWDYVNLFDADCAFVEHKFTVGCSNATLRKLNVPAAHEGELTDIVQRCINDAGGFTADDENSILEAQWGQMIDEQIFYIPTLTINDYAYRGSLKCGNPVYYTHCGPLQAICAGFSADAQPPPCDSDADCAIGVKKDKCGVCGGDGTTCNKASNGKSGGTSGAVVVAIIASIAIAVAVIGFGVVYIRRQRQQMRLDLDNILSSYMPLDGSAPTGPPTTKALRPHTAMDSADNDDI